MEFYVPTLKDSDASKELKETILTSEPNADVKIDLDSQKVIIESQASSETFKQLIIAAGHKIK